MYTLLHYTRHETMILWDTLALLDGRPLDERTLALLDGRRLLDWDTLALLDG